MVDFGRRSRYQLFDCAQSPIGIFRKSNAPFSCMLILILFGDAFGMYLFSAYHDSIGNVPEDVSFSISIVTVCAIIPLFNALFFLFVPDNRDGQGEKEPK